MYLVFDIGGTHTRLAVSQDGKNLDEIETIQTILNFSEAMTSFKKIALKLTQGQKIKGVAGGVKTLDIKHKAKLNNHPTHPLWVGEPLKEALEKALDTAVSLENDSAMAGLGEATFGAGQGHKIVAYIIVSTGVGGARIVDGKIDQNLMGFEPGFQVLSDPPGYLEGYISGDAIRKRYQTEPENLTDPKIWDEMARVLAIGLNNTIVFWSPEIVVLGGSVASSIPLEKVNLHLRELLKIFPQAPEVVRAGLDDKGGLLGSLAYLRQLAKSH